MKVILTLLGLISVFAVSGNELAIKTFGDIKHRAVIFLHGGPGYNAASFEVLAADALASAGFYVVSYDRRGEGRSVDENAAFTFVESFADLLWICDSLKLEKPALIGHSFGGVLATKFAQVHPEKVSALVLVSAPINIQESFKTIIRSSRAIYEKKNDSVNATYLSMLERMDTSSMEYASYCFLHAMQNGFYSTKKRTKDAELFSQALEKKPNLKELLRQMEEAAPKGFWTKENYTTIDLKEDLKKLSNLNIPIFGLYGKEDGLFSPKQVVYLQELVDKENVLYLKKCSHSVYIDQQTVFVKTLNAWLN